MYAVDFEILKGLYADGRSPAKVQPTHKPKHVMTLWHDEDAFDATKPLIHHGSVFFEDQTHDWRWSAGGQFYYYSRVAPRENDDSGLTPKNVLIVYSTRD